MGVEKTKSSQYRGVTRAARGRGPDRWTARIVVGDRVEHLGVFSTEQEAARAFDQAVVKHYREYIGMRNFK